MKNKIRHFSSHEAFDLLQSGEAVLLDIRDEYLQGFKCIDVPAVLQIPFGELAEKLQTCLTKFSIFVPILQASTARKGLRY
jgi:hypothetical protein